METVARGKVSYFDLAEKFGILFKVNKYIHTVN